MAISRSIIKVFIVLQIIGCQGKSNNKSADTSSKLDVINNLNKYSDKTYCAEVQYYNPHTGNHSSYTLTVKVESYKIIEINWPNGGSLDEDNFSNAKLDEKGHSAFSSAKGYKYEVQIIGQSEGCFDNVAMVKQCLGKTKNGNRCKHMTDNTNQHCWQHQNQ